MRKCTSLFLAASVAFLVASATSAQAAPILGSHVDSSIFSANLGGSAGWAYEGQSIGAFDTGGTATLVSRNSGYANSFGFSHTDHSGLTETFGAGAGAGSSASIGGYTPDYLLYFAANGSDFLFLSDDNTQFTDGHSSGGSPGASQADIDIFFNASLATWAFFYDDAGGGLPIVGDDNDYDDLVVTYKTAVPPAASGVPEPASAGLLGLGLLAIGWVARKRVAPSMSAC